MENHHGLRNLQGFPSLLPALAAVWCGLAAVELVLNLLLPRAALHNHELPLGARLLLLTHSMVVLSAFVVALGGPLWLLARLTRRDVARRPGIRWTARSFLTLIVWGVLLLYGASWALFWQIGKFLDYEVLLFLAPHPLQVFHWVDNDIAVSVVISTLAATLLLTEAFPYWISVRPKGSAPARRLLAVTGMALGLSLFGAFFGSVYSGWGERQYLRSALLYTMARNNTSGPFPYILASIRRQHNTLAKQWPDNNLQIVKRPIIPMQKYVASAGGHPIKRWNVIILIIESLRADQLRVYGENRDVMPAVNRLSNEARVFLNAYSQSSHTNYAVVTPLSSHYPLRSPRAYTYPENPSYPRELIYDILKSLGYRTAIFSSSNEYWGGIINYLQTGNVEPFLHAANFKGPTYIAQEDTNFAAWTRETRHAGSIDDRFTVNEAIRWISGLDGKPFFLSMNLQNSHVPYVVPPDFPRRFSSDRLNFTIRFGYFPRDKAQVVKDVYADSLSYVDAQIGRLFDYLKRRNLWDETIIVVTGDHGQAFYEHDFASHGGPILNEVMKVPLIIRAPKLRPTLDHRPAQHIDVPPTVLDLLGLPPHPSFQGVSLLDPRSNSNRSIYMVAQTSDAYQYGIVRSGLKLIYDEWQQQYFLYDLNSDPGEQIDIAPAKSSTVKELARRLHTWYKLQIDYYTDKALHSREYPPIIAD
jgi:arylsulfatase A-like enzyme